MHEIIQTRKDLFATSVCEYVCVCVVFVRARSLVRNDVYDTKY